MTDEETQTILYMQKRAAEFGLQYEIEKAFNSYIDNGDDIAEAAYCALCDWDII